MPAILQKRLLILGAAVAFILILTGLAFGGKWIYHEATKERPSFNTGTIIQKKFDPAHDETHYRQQYAGQDCTSTYDSTTKSYRQSCYDRYITVPYQVFVPDDWNIKIENCNVTKKDGTIWQHKDGTNKCFKKWVDIPESSFNNIKTGQDWRPNA